MVGPFISTNYGIIPRIIPRKMPSLTLVPPCMVQEILVSLDAFPTLLCNRPQKNSTCQGFVRYYR